MGHDAHLGQDNIEVQIVVVVGRAASMLPGHTIAFFDSSSNSSSRERRRDKEIGREKGRKQGIERIRQIRCAKVCTSLLAIPDMLNVTRIGVSVARYETRSDWRFAWWFRNRKHLVCYRACTLIGCTRMQ